MPGLAARAAFIAVGLAALAAPAAASDWIVFLLTVALAKGMVVLGVVLLLRGGLISFGHGLYFAAGAYAVAYAERLAGIHEALALLGLCALAGAGLAALVGLLLMRYRGIFFAMLSLAFSMVLYTLLLKLYTVTGGTDGMSVRAVTVLGWAPPEERLRAAQYYLALGTTAAVLYCGRRFLRSPLGYLMQATQYNEVRVPYMGASVARVIWSSYVFSGALGGVGGGLVAINVGQVAPELAYWVTSGDFVFVAVLGGTGSVFAPFAGSLVFEFVKNYAIKLSPETWQMTLGVVLLLIVYFLPQGIWSLGRRLRSGARAR